MNRICTSLSSAGYDCVLIGRQLPHSQPLAVKPYLQKRLNCWFTKGKLFYIEFNIRLLFFLLKQQADAICSIDLDTVMPGLWMAKLKNWKHIFDAHELFTDVPEVANRYWVRKIWSWVQKKAFKNTDLAYTVGTALASHFEQLYGTKTHVIRNAPVLQNQIPYNPDKQKFILYQGALNVGRGLEKAIEAMKGIPCRLMIAGEGDLSAELRALAVHLGVNEKVEFLGFVAPAELKKLTSRAWIGMNVSENAGLSYYLSLNNKFFDYIHAGLPSLINPFPEYIQLNNRYGVGVITEPTVLDIVKNANALLENESLHQRLSENCQQAAKELTWEMESQTLLHLFENIFEK